MTEATEYINLDKMTIIGLKTEVKRQVGLHKHTQGVLKNTNTSLVKAWRCMYKAGLEKEVTNEIWDHMETVPSLVQIQSELIGIRSKIGDYTNKKGVVSKAHFTINGNYLGSVRTMGDQPKSYMGWFEIERETFEIDFKKLMGSREYGASLSELFIPYTLVPEEGATPPSQPQNRPQAELQPTASGIAPEPVAPKPKRKYVKKVKPESVVQETDLQPTASGIAPKRKYVKKNTTV